MARHRTYSLEFKRLVAQQYLSGEFALAAAVQQRMHRHQASPWGYLGFRERAHP